MVDYLVKPIDRTTLLRTVEGVGKDVRTVLVVDDDMEALRLLTRMLLSTKHGYSVLPTASGHQALDSLRERQPDVMLLDLMMPGLDGFQLLARKDQDPAIRDIPVIVLSGRDPLGEPVASREITATRHSGISVGELLGCIQAISGILSPASTHRQARRERPAELPVC